MSFYIEKVILLRLVGLCVLTYFQVARNILTFRLDFRISNLRRHVYIIKRIVFWFQNNFLFHRTSPDGNELWMYKRLRGENTTVDSPHTSTGAGGLVIRDDHLLVVKDRGVPFWKLPGGYVNPGEYIFFELLRGVFFFFFITIGSHLTVVLYL